MRTASGTVGLVRRDNGHSTLSARVQTLSQEHSLRAGLNGVMLAVQGLGGIAGAQLGVDVDYAKFGSAFGGGWAARLRLVQLPPCALTTPELESCRVQKALPTRNDSDTGRLSADVRIGSTTKTTSSSFAPATVLAVTAGPSGSAGTYAATSLAPTGSWSAGGSSGAFTWSMPVPVPPSTGGPSPQVSIGYASSAVDGRQVSTNNQASWIGDGWDYQPGFVERRYKACSDDQSGGNNTIKTGDLCFASLNAVVSLNGRTSELVRDDSSGAWKLATNDGSRVELLTAAANGDNDGEYWRITTTDGTQYYFGRHRLPGYVSGNPVTQSTFTVPVFGNQTGEPCHATTFDASWCQQAWRWNLDHVVDPHGNTMSYWYAKELNYYGRNLKTAATQYVRGGYLVRIDYGQRSGSEYTTSAPARVSFGVSERCLNTSTFTCSDATFTAANASHWPDVPLDQNCAATEACTDRYTPTFWSRKRLTSISTQYLTTSSTYASVDTWALTQSFPNSGDGLSPALWLSKVARTGKAGGSIALPPITFTGEQLANRVDSNSDGIPALYRYRVNAVYSETGSVVGVSYSAPECSSTTKPSSDSANNLRCYPVWWTPPDAASPIKEYFHKYVVTQVLEQDRTAGQPAKVTNYEYLGGPAWAYDDSEFTTAEHRTWNQYRGYQTVRTRVGATPDPVSLTQTTYFRGMNGDKLPTGVRTVTVADSDNVAIADEPEFAGMSRETSYYDRDGGSVQSSTISVPWRGGVVATRNRAGTTPLTARTAQVAQVGSKTKQADGSWRRSSVERTFSADGVPLAVSDDGDLAKSGDESCTRMSYAAPGSAWITALAYRVEKVSVSCDVSASRPADLVSDVRTYYDGSTSLTAAPTRGLATLVQEVDSWPAGGSAQWATVSSTTYDTYGRATVSKDALGKATTTAYTHNPAGGPVVTMAVTNALGHVVTRTLDPARGAEVAVVDANAKRTDVTYDALGRMAKVWLPGRAMATDTPNLEYTYTVSATLPSSIATKVLKDDTTYGVSYEIFDGLMRQRQTQSVGATGGRLLTDVFFDSRGLEVKRNDEYFNQNVPSGTLLVTPDNQVPAQTVTTYDGMGRVTASILRGYGAEKWRTTTSYDGTTVNVDPPVGQPAVSQLVDAQGRVTERRRYPSGALSGSFDVTRYQYDAKGRLATVTDPGGASWTYEFDLLGRVTKAKDPDTGTTELGYDRNGQVIWTKNAVGQTLWTNYDDLGRVVSTHDGSATGPKRTSYAYDSLAKGYLSSSSRWSGANEYKTAVRGYDNGYRQTGTTFTIPAAEGALQGTYAFQQVYTLNGQLLRAAYPAAGGLPSDILTYTYTQQHQLAKVTGQGGQTYLQDVLYSSYGEPLRLYLGNSGQTLYASYLYEDTTRRLTSATLDRDVAPSRLEDRKYTYDQSGNVLSQIATTPTSADAQCYRYDGLARLTDAWTATDGCSSAPVAGTGGTVGGPQAYWHSYTYDAWGNRKSEVKHDVLGVTSNDVVRTYGYPGAAQPHTLRSVEQVGAQGTALETFDYDAAGRMKARSQGGSDYLQQWDAEGKLVTSTKNGASSTFLYDAAGQRLIKREPGSVTLYMHGTELKLNTATQQVSGTRIVDVGGASAVRTSDGKITMVIEDHQGTGQWAVDKATLAATQRKLGAFGAERVSPATPWPADKGFVGGTQDASTGLVHLGAREYDPTTGAFISADPLMDLQDPEHMNGYAYSKHSPVTYSDASGLAPLGPTDDSTMGYTYDPDDKRMEPDAEKVNYNSNGTTGAGTSKAGTSKPRSSAASTSSGGSSRSEAEVRRAVEIKKRSVVDIIKEAGAQIVLEVLGINDIRDCFGSGNVGSCLSMAVGFLPWGKILKAKRIGEALFRAFRGFVRHQRDMRWADDVLGGAACAVNSFTPDTRVVLASGRTKAIGEISLGDEVLAEDPTTGERQARPVEAVIRGDGVKQLVQITVAASDDPDEGKSVVATEGHPIWVEGPGEWREAGQIAVGDLLRTGAGTFVQVTAVRHFAQKQVVYNLTVSGLHTYFVQVGNSSVLTHNCGRKTYQTYTKPNPDTGEVYSGRTSGTGSPRENVARRDAGHHMNEKGFGPAELDETSPNPLAIRGREQQLIERNGGAQSMGGTSGNAINGISPKNPRREQYLQAADEEFE